MFLKSLTTRIIISLITSLQCGDAMGVWGGWFWFVVWFGFLGFFCIFQAQKAHKAHFGDGIGWIRKAKHEARKAVLSQEPRADSWPWCPAPCSGSWTQQGPAQGWAEGAELWHPWHRVVKVPRANRNRGRTARKRNQLQDKNEK